STGAAVRVLEVSRTPAPEIRASGTPAFPLSVTSYAGSPCAPPARCTDGVTTTSGTRAPAPAVFAPGAGRGSGTLALCPEVVIMGVSNMAVSSARVVVLEHLRQPAAVSRDKQEQRPFTGYRDVRRSGPGLTHQGRPAVYLTSCAVSSSPCAFATP